MTNRFEHTPALSTSDFLLSLQLFVLSSLASMVDNPKAFDRVNQENVVKHQNSFIQSLYSKVTVWLQYGWTTTSQLEWFSDSVLNYWSRLFPSKCQWIRDILACAQMNTSSLTPCLKTLSSNDKNALQTEIDSLLETARKMIWIWTLKCRSIWHRRWRKNLGNHFRFDCFYRKHCKQLVSRLLSIMFLLKELGLQGVSRMYTL